MRVSRADTTTATGARRTAVDTLTLAVATAIYLSITIAPGCLGYKQTKSSEDYLLAGRKRHPLGIALPLSARVIVVVQALRAPYRAPSGEAEPEP